MTLTLPNFFLPDETPQSERQKVIQTLGEFRQEWQVTADGQDLTSIYASVGLLLFDITDRLNLSPQERHAILGAKLTKDIEDFMEGKVLSK